MTKIHDEFDLVRRMRAEVPVRQDLSGVERRLAELRTRRRPVKSRRLPRLRWGLALAAACVLGVGGWQLTRGGAEEGVRPAVAHHPASTTAPATVLELGLWAAGKGSYILDPEDYHYLGLTVEREGVTAAMSVLSTGVVDEPGRLP